MERIAPAVSTEGTDRGAGAEPHASTESPGTISVLLASRGMWWSSGLLAVVVPLATWSNVTSLREHADVKEAANSFTAVNASVFLAMLGAVLLVTRAETVSTLRSSTAPMRHAVLGAQGRAAGLLGVAASFVFLGLAAAVAVPLLHSRGLPVPSASTVIDYAVREATAAARLGVVAVAIAVLCGRRRAAVTGLIAFLIIDGVLEAHIGWLQTYGPVGAINAFSDPSHRHQFSLGMGAAIALAWALTALISASLTLDVRLDSTARLNRLSKGRASDGI
jgi:hypothetical protein